MVHQTGDIPHYEGIAHAKVRLRYHLIFATKYRKRALIGIEDAVVASFREVESRSNFRIHEIGVGNGDHIHLLVSFKPSLSLASVVRRMKTMTTISLWGSHSAHLGKTYWGSKRRLWSGGYFCATVGEINEDVVTRYVRNQ